MARKKRAEAGAINIRIPPHSTPERYEELLRDAHKLRKGLPSRGDQMLLISYLERKKEAYQFGGIFGVLARFTNIEKDEPWFNLETNEKAKDDDIEQISIPDNLRPNYKPFEFIFFPNKHRLVFEHYSESSSLSHTIVKNFFERLFRDDKILQKYGPINVDIMSDKSSLENIWKIPTLKTLDIQVERPNPDDLEREEQIVLNKMQAMRANRIEKKLTAIPGQSLKPDHETKILANVALNNGEVIATGRDDQNQKVEISTIKFHRTERTRYDPDITSSRDAFNMLAQRFA